MDIMKNITINLNENDVKEIIANYLCNKGYEAKPNDVFLKYGSRLEGFGMMETEVNFFDGASVNVKMK